MKSAIKMATVALPIPILLLLTGFNLCGQEQLLEVDPAPGSVAWLQAMDRSLRVLDDVLQEERCLFKCSACCCCRPRRVSGIDIRRLQELKTALLADAELALTPYPKQTSIGQVGRRTLLEACVAERRCALFSLLLRTEADPFDVADISGLLNTVRRSPEMYRALLAYTRSRANALPRATALLVEQFPSALGVLTELFVGPDPAHYLRDFRHEGKTLLDLELEQELPTCVVRPVGEQQERMRIIRQLVQLDVRCLNAGKLRNLQRSAYSRVRCETVLLFSVIMIIAAGYSVNVPGLSAVYSGLLISCLSPSYQAIRFARAARRARLLELPTSGPEAV